MLENWVLSNDGEVLQRGQRHGSFINRPGLCGPSVQPTFNISFNPHIHTKKTPKLGNQLFLFPLYR